MIELVNELGAFLPLLLILTSAVLYFQSRSDRRVPAKGREVDAPLHWNETDDARLRYAMMPLDRLVPLYCESGSKETKELIASELLRRGWVEKQLGSGRRVLEEPRPATHMIRLSISDETLSQIRTALRR